MVVERTRTTAQATAEGLRVFVAGLPWKLQTETLQRDFEECGVVEDIFVLRDPEGNSRGKAFITFREKKAVEAALAFDSTDYGGRTIYVKLAEAKRESKTTSKGVSDDTLKEKSGLAESMQPKKFPDEKPEGCTSLCIKNIGSASDAEVRKFLRCRVQSVRIVKDKISGEPRGIAFVDFANSDDVDKAMSRNGKDFNGQVVEMRYEAPKQRPRPDGCMSVAIKKLGPKASEDDVWGLFEGLPSLTDVRVIRDKEQKCTGLAFAEFTNGADVEAAIRRDGMSVQNRTVFVCYETKQKKERTAEKDEAVSATEKKRKCGTNDKVGKCEAVGETKLAKRKKEREKQKMKKKAATPVAVEEEGAMTLKQTVKKRKKRKKETAFISEEGEVTAKASVKKAKTKGLVPLASVEDAE
eukprot:TRINITY_DN70978_c0_g1_i1.p1 TRINITY_DN70978_c0_g1~~TRINITY_DN70978_c0_g1_i1.p1  ORF type:complete len:410 (+),score=103.52 TRINITY_DN70978_c0_g1_i1:105-1334(+)